MFAGRKLVIATKHKKEAVIAPIIEQSLGVKCFVPKNFDTDLLGTFSGEVERKQNPLETAKQKCLQAMKYSNCDLGIASEGSFGPHPSLFFTNADDEFLIFIDKKNNLEIVVREVNLETNFNAITVSNENEMLDFAKKVGFPSHALILRKSEKETTHLVKGIKDEKKLKNEFQKLLEKFGSVYVETDMRAMNNPTRMKVIQKASEKLKDKIASCCPKCNTPGFGITEAKKGLPCSLCGTPTNTTLSFIYKCIKCSFQKEDLYPNNKETEDPMYCNYCNP
ncbi:MAG: DUF6671 family protein [Polaribacter sp.]|jgi:hypothetical protein